MKLNKGLSAKHKTMLALSRTVAGYLASGFLVMLLVVGLQFLLPSLIGNFIDSELLQEGQGDLGSAALLLLGLAFAYCFSNSLRFYLFDIAGNKIVVALRNKLFRQLSNMEIGFFDGQKVGELSSRLSVDVETIRDLLTIQVAILFRTLVMFVGGIWMIFYLSWQLSILLLLALPLSFGLGHWIGGRVRNTSRNLQSTMAQSLDIAQETFINIRQIKAFNLEEQSRQKYLDASDNVLNTAVRQGALFAAFQGASGFITYAALVLILWAGGSLVLNNSLTIGELTSFVMYAGFTTAAITGILGFWAHWQSADGASERVFDLLQRPPEIKRQAAKPLLSNVISGGLTFNKVSFSYPQRPTEKALNDVSFHIEKGEKVAFVGASGAGKSTIASLILGFYEVDTGSIAFDNEPYFNYSRKCLNQQIAIVEQEPNLFSGTIAQNIALGLDSGVPEQESIEMAAKKANAHDFIMRFEQGYDTEVGQNGVQLSGGQKQRIAIARAILRDPTLLILDEASSALDSESEIQVQEALNRLMQGRTTLIIAHRLSTILHADKIVVLDKGRTVQIGSHDELIADKHGTYMQLVNHQLHSEVA